MRYLNKTLAATAAAALMAALGVAVAQTNDQNDPMATPQQQVDVMAQPGEHIYFFRDQGNSPETDPAAHLLLIKHDQMRAIPVAESTTTTTTTVAQASTPAEPAPPVAVDNTTTTDTTAMPADTAPVLAPKADRN